MIRLFLSALSLFHIWGETAQAQSKNDYHWPMAARRALTSTFGEYRRGRIHAGVDLKTWGKEGYPVLAIDDGYVWRVRTSPWGYGRAVYLKLPDGRTAVYAHLSSFPPNIEKSVEAEQERKGTYSVDIYPEPTRIIVKKGDVVGYSGSSGSGSAHLHFELRDHHQRPINPLECGFKVKDTIPPSIRALALLPLNPASRVEGDIKPHHFRVRWDKRRKIFRSSRRFHVRGSIGVGVSVYDRANASKSSNRLAPYSLTLQIDGREVFRTTYSTFEYASNHQVELDRNVALRRKGAGLFNNMFRRRGNRLPLYGDFREGDGVLHAGINSGRGGVYLKQGVHLLRVEAEDISGNRSAAEVELLANAGPIVSGVVAEKAGNAVEISARVRDDDRETLIITFEKSPDEGRSWLPISRREVPSGSHVKERHATSDGLIFRVLVADAYGSESFKTCAPLSGSVMPLSSDSIFTCIPVYYPDYSVIRILSNRFLAASPQVKASWPDGSSKGLLIRQTGLKKYETILPFNPESSGVVKVSVSGKSPDGIVGRGSCVLIQQTVRISGGSVRSDDSVAQVRFGSKAVYEPLFARVELADFKGKRGLIPVGKAYRFSPEEVPFNGKAELSLRYPPGYDDPRKLGIYRLEDKGGWSFIDNRLNPKTGTVGARIPSFSTYRLFRDEVPPLVTRLRPRTGSRIKSRKPRLSATIRDKGSGIGREEDIVVRLDGKPLIFEYDPEKQKVISVPKILLQPGAHIFEVVVRDMCGNETLSKSRFTIRRRR